MPLLALPLTLANAHPVWLAPACARPPSLLVSSDLARFWPWLPLLPPSPPLLQPLPPLLLPLLPPLLLLLPLLLLPLLPLLLLLPLLPLLPLPLLSSISAFVTAGWPCLGCACNCQLPGRGLSLAPLVLHLLQPPLERRPN